MFGVSKDGKVKEIDRLLIRQACNSLVNWIYFLHWDQVKVINLLENRCNRECYERGLNTFLRLLHGGSLAPTPKTEGKEKDWKMIIWRIQIPDMWVKCLKAVKLNSWLGHCDIYVTLGKCLSFDYPLCYSDKVRQYQQASVLFSPSVWGRAGQLLKQTTPKFGDLILWKFSSHSHKYSNVGSTCDSSTPSSPWGTPVYWLFTSCNSTVT